MPRRCFKKKNSEFQYPCIKSDCTDSSKAASGVRVKPQDSYRKFISEGSACTRLTDALGITGIGCFQKGCGVSSAEFQRADARPHCR